MTALIRPLPFRKLNSEEREILITAYKENPLSSILLDYAKEANTNLKTLQRVIQNHLLHASLALQDAKYFEERSKATRYTDYFVVEEPDFVYTGDWEMPDTNRGLVELLLTTAKKRGIKTLVHLGDLFSFDQTAFTTWTERYKDEKSYTFRTVLDEVKTIFNQYLEWFDKIYIIASNHDDRLGKATGGELTLDMFFSEFPKVTYTPYPYMYIKTPRGTIKVVHPQAFSQNPVTLFKDLYAAERGPNFDPYHPQETLEKCHLILAHTHIAQAGTSPDGVYQFVSSPTMRDVRRTQYASMAVGRHRQWDLGFGVVTDGYIENLLLSSHNWEKELS